MRELLLVAAAAATVVVGWSGPAVAQTGGVALNQFEPAPAGDDLFAVPSASIGGHLQPRAALLFDYAHEPLILSQGDTEGAVVSSQGFLRVDASLALWDRLLASVDVPFAVLQSGEDPLIGGVQLRSPSSAELGDVRLGLRLRLLGEYFDAFQLALGTYVHLPTGPTNSFAAEGAVRVTPHVSAGGRTDSFVYSASVGAMVRGSDNPHTFTFGAGAGLLLAGGLLQVGPEIYGATQLNEGSALAGGAIDLSSGTTTNAEVLGGAKLRLVKSLVIGAAGGPGLTNAIGTPSFRVVGTIAWDPEPPRPGAPVDTDDDGIFDPSDACPEVKGAASADPKKHGCPPDRDEDGILDASDACPEVKGVANADATKNGCPPDRDGDGVLDATDACPDVKGVKSDDPKKNGCPADRDEDGIPDASDACPDEKGVKSADPKKNGCPGDVDTDGDGILDPVDACPKEKGAANADPTKNGCPESVRVTDTEIIILKQVQFLFGKSGIKQTVDPISEDLLTQVRDVIKQHSEFVKIEVQGHTDNVGDPRWNMRLSQERAETIRNWLVEKGIPADKLSAKGYGQTVPIADNATPEGRQKNRRVQFVILEKTEEKPAAPAPEKAPEPAPEKRAP